MGPARLGQRDAARLGVWIDAREGGYFDGLGRKLLRRYAASDKRVVVLEKTNARFLESLPEPVDIITIDVSFISIKVLLPVIVQWLSGKPDVSQGGKESVIALIKPQFEAGRQQVGRNKGVIRDPLIHRQVLLDVLSIARDHGYFVRGLIRSPLTGPKGTVEFLTWLEPSGEQAASIEDLVDSVVPATSE